MFLSPQLPLICPLDGKVLTHRNKQLVCESGHSFDIARQGYVNLLPVQHKKSRQPGDSQEMVLARQRFLNGGYYDAILKSLSQCLERILPESKTINLFDAGCGEGFYLSGCLEHLKANYPVQEFACLGLDISKPAIIAAARRNKHITWAVGTNQIPPISPQSIDIIICMFGFYDLAVFNNVLKPGGHIILADPGPKHLLELRQVLYESVKSKAETNDYPGFDIIDEIHLEYSLNLSQPDLADLLLMTPHYFRAPKLGKEKVMAMTELSLTVDVMFRILKPQQISV